MIFRFLKIMKSEMMVLKRARRRLSGFLEESTLRTWYYWKREKHGEFSDAAGEVNGRLGVAVIEEGGSEWSYLSMPP